MTTYLTTNEAADYLKLARWTVRNKWKAMGLPFQKKGSTNRLVTEPGALDAWVNARHGDMRTKLRRIA